MRICIVTSSFRRFQGDYAGQHVYAQAVGLARRHDVYVIYPTDQNNPDKARDPFHHLPFQYPFKTYPMAQVRGWDILNVFKLFTRMRREIHKAKHQYKIDLFYAFWAIPSAFICSLTCGKTPFIIGLAGADDKVFGRGGIVRPLVKHALKKASRVISLSQELKDNAIAMGTGEDIISVIPSGINTSEYIPRNKHGLRAELGLPDRFLAMYVGSLFKLKRIDWLIRLSAELGRTHDFHSVIIGDGPEKEYLEQMAAEFKCNNVHFMGKIPYNRVPLYISAADALVLFSETEGLPSVVQEALASGVPVVATAVGGITDIIWHGVNGYVIKNENEARECLTRLMESQDLMLDLSANARCFAEAHLSHERVFEQVTAVCESVLSKEQREKEEVLLPEPVISKLPAKKPSIGIISTFPAKLVSHFVEVQAPYARNIRVIAPKLTRSDVEFHPLKYKIGTNFINQIFNQISAQVRMSFKIIKLGNKVDCWIFLGGDVFLLPILTARLKGIPTMLSLLGNLEYETTLKNNALNPVLRFLKKTSCMLADRIILLSRGLAKKWHLNGYKRKTLIAQSQFVDLSQFNIKKPLSRRNKIIGYVGRLSPEKGVWNLVKSMSMVLRQDEGVKFLIIGNGPLFTSIEKYLKTDNLKAKVQLTGQVPYEQIPEWMNELRLLVLPSFSEGLPATLLEAMACGTPVLATPVGAIDEIIVSGKTGFLLENNSREAIARGIIQALNHPEGETIASAARKLVESKYSLFAVRRNYRKVILEASLLNGRHNI